MSSLANQKAGFVNSSLVGLKVKQNALCAVHSTKTNSDIPQFYFSTVIKKSLGEMLVKMVACVDITLLMVAILSKE